MTKKAWTIKELLDPKACPPWPSDKTGAEFNRLVDERQAFMDQRDALDDEVAHARVLARRGLPMESWPKDHPARDAWLSVHREKVRVVVKAINEAEDDFEALATLGNQLASAAGLCCSGPTEEIPRDQTVSARVVRRDGEGLPLEIAKRATAGSFGSFDAKAAARSMGGH